MSAPATSTPVPQPPILVMCGHEFLDVHTTLAGATGHLAGDVRAGLLEFDRLDAFDAAGRVLDVWRNRRGDLHLTVRSDVAQPDLCRRRIDVIFEAAGHPAYAEQRAACLEGGELPALPITFGEVVAALAGRFDGDHDPEDPTCAAEHTGSRLHNFWHAIAG